MAHKQIKLFRKVLEKNGQCENFLPNGHYCLSLKELPESLQSNFKCERGSTHHLIFKTYFMF